MLTKQGHPGREMFVLLEGTVDVVRDDKLVNRLGPGDFVGEGALMLSKPRNATITATSPIRALVITHSNFTRLLEEDPRSPGASRRRSLRERRRSRRLGRRMLHRDHRADVFARIPLFAGCSKRDLRKIASIADELDLK